MKVLWAYLLVSVAVWAHLFVCNSGDGPEFLQIPICLRNIFPRKSCAVWAIRTAARPLDRRAWRGARECSMPRPRPA
jgi:hypothetical protein